MFLLLGNIEPYISLEDVPSLAYLARYGDTRDGILIKILAFVKSIALKVLFSPFTKSSF